MNRVSTLLLMPAWSPGRDAGIKCVTIHPGNGRLGLPAVQGTYIYLDATTGVVRAIIEAKSLTTRRTAAASALASSFLSHPEATSLLMIGTGALAPHLIRAHAGVRPIRRVFVWGRDFKKARAVCDRLALEDLSVLPVQNIEDRITEADIISCATLSPTPLLAGKYLRAGQHVDLVGAYRPDMREADDEAIKKASVFVDSWEGGLKESGDIVIPLQTGILHASDIKADLFDLCSSRKIGRTHAEEITLFKSVGHALEDLAAAAYYYNQYIHERDLSAHSK